MRPPQCLDQGSGSNTVSLYLLLYRLSAPPTIAFWAGDLGSHRPQAQKSPDLSLMLCRSWKFSLTFEQEAVG